jgi:hypothetical protein
MHTIFVGGIAIGKFSMGSNEPLGTPSLPPKEGFGTRESETSIMDDPGKAGTALTPRSKRKSDQGQ